MFEMNASTKLKSLNAYVTGIGASKRVVVWDTTIAKATLPQTLSVFGHEMGHYVLDHVPKGLAFLAGLLLVGLYLGFRGMQGVLARWGGRWAVRGADDWASLPVLLLLLSVFSFLAEPAGNSFSRYIEHQADIYGLEVIHGIVPNSGEVAAEAFQVLGEVNLSDPNPPEFIRVWLDRKSTRLNSSHSSISYAVFCLKKKKTVILDTLVPCPPTASVFFF